MSDADTLLRDGDLAGARTALVEIVKSSPSNQQARMFLFQLFVVLGEWDKARNQLDALAQLSPEAQMLGVTYNQAIQAEKERAEVFAGTRELKLLAGDGGWAAGIARGITLLAQGETAAAEEARDAAFEQAPDTPGTLDGIAFEWIGDADGRFGPTFEAIVSGRYGLIPFDQIASITSEGPHDLRDTVWYPVQLGLRGGQSTAAFLPARYPGSETAAQADEKLGRVTSWEARDGGEHGIGQRLWTLSTGDDRGLLDVRNLSFA